MNEQTLGALIRERREAANLTQTDLGDRVGKSQRWVSNLENGGIKQPRLHTLRAIADAISVSVADLIYAAGYAESLELADRLARESAAFQVDADSPEARLIPLIRRIPWTERDLRMLEEQLRILEKGLKGGYFKDGQ